MASTITFLGTAGDMFVCGKQLRGSGGIIIQTEGYQFHLDPGPGALVRAMQFGINLRQNTALLVSANTILHANDVNAVISAMTHEGLDVQGVMIAADSFINGTDETCYLSPGQMKLLEKVIGVGPEKRIGIENIEIKTLHTKSKDSTQIGFKFYTRHFVLSYSSDTGYSQDIAKQYDHSDILILNVPLPSSEKSDTSLNSDDAVKIINRIKPKLAIITHFGKKMLSSDPLYESREIQKQTGVQVIAAKDGLEVNPLSYSASLKQKTLNLYN